MNERQLLLAKAIMNHAEAIIRGGGQFDGGIALLLMQDAIECVLHRIASDIGAKVEQGTTFPRYWKLIEDAERGKAARELPMFTEMDRLNRARVSLKHHANCPDRADVEGYLRNARAFLQKTCEAFFGINFERLSEVSLLPQGDVRARLEEAEEALSNADLRGALILCSKANGVISERSEYLFSTSWLVSMPPIPEAVRQAIRAEVAHLHGMIRNLGDLVLAQTFGQNLMDRQFLNWALPKFSGDEVVFQDGVLANTTLETGRHCIQLLARYALRMERELDAMNHPAWWH